MTTVATLTESEVKELVGEWYRKLDIHAPMVDLLPMLADEELEMRFPEATVHGYAGFEGWYQRVIRLFFDEVHEMKDLRIKIQDDRADITLVVYWETSVWNPPAARSQRIMLDAFQTWVVSRSPETRKPVITRYVVDNLSYREGSARL